jgi:hypothetical protein
MHEGNNMGLMTTLKKPTLESPMGGGHTPQHGVGGRRAGVEPRGEPFPEITLNGVMPCLINLCFMSLHTRHGRLIQT